MTQTVKPLINPVPPAGSEEKVEALYQPIKQMLGMVPSAIKLFGISPFLLEEHVNNIGYFMQHPTLSPPLLAMIRLLVAKEKHCAYCITLNEGMLIEAGFELEALRAAQKTPSLAPLNEKEKALLLLVLKATNTSHEINEADMQVVRELGWTDFDIFDAVNHGAIAMAIDIVLDTFKVTQEGVL